MQSGTSLDCLPGMTKAICMDGWFNGCWLVTDGTSNGLAQYWVVVALGSLRNTRDTSLLGPAALVWVMKVALELQQQHVVVCGARANRDAAWE